MRVDRTDLPAKLRAAIETETGPIRAAEPASTGNHADIASTLHGRDRVTFVKAARRLSPEEDGPEVRSLRWEAAVNPYVTEFAPRLRWKVEAGGWLALGFDHIDGRKADYTPGSPDLPMLAKVLHALQSTPGPGAVRLRAERRWATDADDVSRMSGDALLHTDLNEDNLIITPDGGAFLVDWAFVSRGAAWIEPALLILWLLKAGHTPAQAEQWVTQFPSWHEAGAPTIDMFSRILAERWRHNSVRNPAPWAVEHAAAAERWAHHRAEDARGRG
jgi:hypothetical protein